MKSGKRKISSLGALIGGILLIVLINMIGQKLYHRFDLTSDRRYSLSEPTKDLLDDIDDLVYVRVYLDGDLPPSYQKLREATKDMLNEFRALNPNVNYEFINPNENPDERERRKIYTKLSKEGLQYASIKYRDGDKDAERIIFPGAIISYKGKQRPIQLLKSIMGAPEEFIINSSVQQIEYELASNLEKLNKTIAKKIAFIEGHGEYKELEVADFAYNLEENYEVSRLSINGKLKSLQGLDAIIIAGPDSVFSEKDKYIIDQFVMSGGKVMWFIEGAWASMDSLQDQNVTVSIPKSVNLEDQLFKYGVRLNTNLILDLQALPIPVVTGMIGNQPRQELFPWFYFPLVFPMSEHPIVKNLDGIKTEFASSLDTIGRKGIKKNILLSSSPYSRLQSTPSRISLNLLREKPDRQRFREGPLPIAVLLEGTFESVFNNRLPEEIIDNTELKFRSSSEPTKMIVVSDANIIKNRVNWENEQYFLVGFDRYTQKQYANKEFLMNSIDYLLAESRLIEVRTKDFKMRILDKQKVADQRTNWQIINTAGPIALISLFGLWQLWARRRRYSKKKES